MTDHDHMDDDEQLEDDQLEVMLLTMQATMNVLINKGVVTQEENEAELDKIYEALDSEEEGEGE